MDVDERQRDREERIIEGTRGAARQSWHAAASYKGGNAAITDM